MTEAVWYEVVSGPRFFQGDLLRDCPVFSVGGLNKWPLDHPAELTVEARTFDLIVMSQSCDLENDKVEQVLLAKINAWSDVVAVEVRRGNETVKSSKFRKQLIEGSIPSLSLLHTHQGASLALPWSVVDFHQLFTLPKAFLEEFSRTAGPRLRLLSPYREHLAQAFARYVMRVGLPHDARAFEKESNVKV